MARVKCQGSWGCIDVNGKLAIEARFESISDFAGHGLAEAIDEAGRCFINRCGETVLRPRFKLFHPFDEYGLSLVKSRGKYGFMDISGRAVIRPQFSDAAPFAVNGLAKAYNNQGCGFINVLGEWLIPPLFSDASSFSADGLAIFSSDGEKWGCINSSGQVEIAPRFADIEFTDSPHLLKVRDEERVGYIDRQGRWISDYIC
jgi:hypothetical protein